eukprot:gene24135-9719_t
MSQLRLRSTQAIDIGRDKVVVLDMEEVVHEVLRLRSTHAMDTGRDLVVVQ